MTESVAPQVKTRPSPSQVFTPRAIVRPDLFEPRGEKDLEGRRSVQQRTEDALSEPGSQLLVYGDTGVGKSSLVEYAVNRIGRKAVRIECNSSMNFDAMAEHAIRQLVTLKEVKRSVNLGAGAGGEAEGSLFKIATVRGNMILEGGLTQEYEVLELAPLEALIQAMKQSGKTVLILDNFQNVKVEHRSIVAQAMETMADRSHPFSDGTDPKIAVIGIASDADTLLGSSMSFGRRCTEVGVPRMPDHEIKSILTGGFRLLGLQIPEPSLEKLLFYSDGFPYFAHILGLAIAKAADAANAEFVTPKMVEAALETCAADVSASFTARFEKACEVSGSTQPRKHLLRLLSTSSAREWKATEVEAIWKREFGEEEKSYSFLNVALGRLILPENGNMLQRTGTRRRYVYKFSDPHLRPYLRMAFDAQVAS